MNKALIVYYSEHHSSDKNKVLDKSKPSNVEKVATELTKLFAEKKYVVDSLQLEPVLKMHLKDQFKKEKEIELLNKIPNLNNYKYVVIGTPIVGAMTSSPVINSFIRQLKFSKTNLEKPLFVIYSTGIVHGFEIKKITSLLSMKSIKPIDSECFSSMFDFDSKKLAEVKVFFERFFD